MIKTFDKSWDEALAAGERGKPELVQDVITDGGAGVRAIVSELDWQIEERRRKRVLNDLRSAVVFYVRLYSPSSWSKRLAECYNRLRSCCLSRELVFWPLYEERLTRYIKLLKMGVKPIIL